MQWGFKHTRERMMERRRSKAAGRFIQISVQVMLYMYNVRVASYLLLRNKTKHYNYCS
jgi:hypothetical protein